MALSKKEAQELIRKRHPEWQEHQRRWRWLADSLEGGNRYRHADYTIDATATIGSGSSFAPWYNFGLDPQTSQPYPVTYRQIVDRNLIPHLRETGVDGRDLYVMRLARTPVPRLVERTIETHLSKVYAKEIRRDGPPELLQWWKDIDGRGTEVDRWVRESFAPLFLVLGQLDVAFDHPPAPDDAKVETRADALSLGLDGCVARIVLPENLVWWRLDRLGSVYCECLVFERGDTGARWQHWTDRSVDAYSTEGDYLPQFSHDHPFGRVPVVRVFDRKLVRQSHSGKSRYESVAELQKSIYNLESERILSDVQQSHAQLMGPEDFLQQDSEIPIGPDRILPKKRVMSGSSIGYEGFEYIEPPKGAQEALRQHVIDQQDTADRDGVLLKPAGMAAQGTTAQSGISKIADQQDGNAYLAAVAETLEAAEEQLAAYALVVLGNGSVSPGAEETVEVVYPRQFELFSAADLAQAIDDLQRLAAGAGALPETEGELMARLVELVLPGLADERLDELRGELRAFLARAAAGPDTDPIRQSAPPVPGLALTTAGMPASPSTVLTSPIPS